MGHHPSDPLTSTPSPNVACGSNDLNALRLASDLIEARGAYAVSLDPRPWETPAADRIDAAESNLIAFILQRTGGSLARGADAYSEVIPRVLPIGSDLWCVVPDEHGTSILFRIQGASLSPDESDDERTTDRLSDTLARESFRATVDRYNEATAYSERVERRCREAFAGLSRSDADDINEKNRLIDLIETSKQVAIATARSLAESVQLLAVDERLERLHTLCEDWPVRAATHQGKIFVSGIGDVENMGEPLLVILNATELRRVD